MMNDESSSSKRWFAAAIVAGVAYFAPGVGFAVLAKHASSHEGVVAWRLAAWIAAGIVFAIHVWYEHIRLRNSPRTSAWHATVAVGIGAFLIAAAALFHSLSAKTGRPGMLGLSLVLWPIITGVPAFIAAFAISAMFRRFRHDEASGRNP